MEPKQETMEERYDEKFLGCDVDGCSGMFCSKHQFKQALVGRIPAATKEFIRSEITHAIEAHDKKLAEKVKAIVIDPEKEHTWQWVFGAARMRKNVLDLLNKQI